MSLTPRFLLAVLVAGLGGCTMKTPPANPPGAAIASAVAPSCKGHFALLRLDKIKRDGTVAGVMKAVDDHKAWYRANGVNTNDVLLVPVLKYDPISKSYVNSDDSVVTLHVNPPAEALIPGKEADHGKAATDAWNAYVKEYDDNSDILVTLPVCLPDLAK